MSTSVSQLVSYFDNLATAAKTTLKETYKEAREEAASASSLIPEVMEAATAAITGSSPSQTLDEPSLQSSIIFRKIEEIKHIDIEWKGKPYRISYKPNGEPLPDDFDQFCKAHLDVAYAAATPSQQKALFSKPFLLQSHPDGSFSLFNEQNETITISKDQRPDPLKEKDYFSYCENLSFSEIEQLQKGWRQQAISSVKTPSLSPKKHPLVASEGQKDPPPISKDLPPPPPPTPLTPPSSASLIPPSNPDKSESEKKPPLKEPPPLNLDNSLLGSDLEKEREIEEALADLLNT